MENFHLDSSLRMIEEEPIIKDMLNDFNLEEEDENVMDQMDDCSTYLIHPYQSNLIVGDH